MDRSTPAIDKTASTELPRWRIVSSTCLISAAKVMSARMCGNAHHGKPEMHIDSPHCRLLDAHMRTHREYVEDFIRSAEEISGRKISALAKDAGIAHTTFTRFLKNGDYKYIPKIDKLIAIAGVSGASLPPELGGVGESNVRTVPIFSWVSAGKLGSAEGRVEPDDTLEISGLPAGKYVATRVVGDSMDLYSPEGSTVIVNLNETDPVDGRAYIFNHRGETTYKVYRSNPIRLSPHSTNKSHDSIFPKEGKWSIVGRVRRTIFDL